MTGVTSTRHVVLRSWPNGALTSGDLEVVEAPVPELRSGDVLVRNTWLSIDPSIRIRLSRQTPGGYLPPFAPGQALEGLALGVVERSESSAFAVGDIVTHTLGFREHALISADTATIGGYGSPTVVRPGGLPEQWFLGPLGSSGLTAYAGIVGILDVGPADTVWVSSAAGAVGGLAAGLAVARGATVIGSAGSAAKVAHLRASGLADAFDHHESLPAAVAAAAPDGIDAYFDCVGGDHLTAAIDALRPNGRIAMCGQMSQYDAADAPSLPGNLFQFVSKNLSMRGYRAGSFLHLEADMRAEITSLIDAGRLGYDEWVFDGLDSAPAALVSMLAGENIGKTLVRLG